MSTTSVQVSYKVSGASSTMGLFRAVSRKVSYLTYVVEDVASSHKAGNVPQPEFKTDPRGTSNARLDAKIHSITI